MTMFESYHWLNRAKSRYYTITVKKEVVDKIMLDYKWGGCNSNRGGKKSIMVHTKELEQHITEMMKRRKRRGYELIAPVLN